MERPLQARKVVHRTSTISGISSNNSKKGRKKDSIEQFITSNQILIKSSLSQLRYMILVDDLSPTPTALESSDEVPSTHSYRIYVWSILLRVPPLNTDIYLKLISKGRPSCYDKIINDTFRTLTSDLNFHKKISENSLIRVLSSYAWSQELNNNNDITNSNQLSPYVQGMNVLLAPVLFSSKSEPQAFAIFHQLLTKNIPTYVTPMLNGVHTGLALLELCLEIIDPKLFQFLETKYLKAEIYGFASTLTLCSCTPPLTEVLKLWDFLFAYGCHMNILFIIAQLILLRSKLMVSKSPMTLLRNFPPLNSKEIIKLSVSFVTKLPDELYDLLCRHTYDEKVDQLVKDYTLKRNS
ncbi:hypothetical protein PACTADRAFT_48260 [Pachysolen tannophilus NRRL Y-2460]|uniref:Rab-GAP TBC domain-containing protein n=1 Tax=Pachysolen tannophilus NRRL Y-2460 TaxID=669874 RepID=A0A1E4U3C9_PACTA|nr:hypothetical protein PACTADRAFT_48260 [Pachysolen tannophilus NRRL Y-2460]